MLNSIFKYLLLVTCVFLSFFAVFAQEEEFIGEEEEELIFKPTIGVGAGMFTYYGDISKGKKTNSPIVSRVGFDLMITQQITPHFSGSFYVLQGKVGANERSLTRNENFESTITMGGINVNYNFDNFLKNKNRIFEPYASLGIEAFEFLSKTDKVDAYGNTYYYWSDGSIRSLSETDPDASNAIRLQRDFVYESDIRSLDIDGFGEYPERSYAIPIGIGVNWLATDRISFRIGTNFHYSFTDMIDGISNKSIGNREGTKANDHFLFTSFHLQYNIAYGVGKDKEDAFDEEGDPLLAEDEDGDGVNDFKDECGGTPYEASVDEKGCPLDSDKDGVADYMDDEPDTPDSVHVDNHGVTITDEQYEEWYRMYAGYAGKTTKITHTSELVANSSDPKSSGKRGAPREKQYTVRIGEYSSGVPREVAEQLLAIHDVNTWEEKGTVFITVGNYDSLPDAVKRQLELIEQGFADADVVAKNKENGLTPVDTGNETASKGTTFSDPAGKTVYRVQVGAFGEKVKGEAFKDIPGLVAMPMDDGLTHYFSGSFDNYKAAAERKVDLILEGYDGAFVAPFKGGKRVSLGSTGEATQAEGSIEDINVVNEGSKSTVDKSLVKFSVQIGLFKENVPAKTLMLFMSLNDVDPVRTDEGVTKYTSGKFDSYQDAALHKQKLVAKGIGGAFVVGKFKTNIISSQEAIELLKK